MNSDLCDFRSSDGFDAVVANMVLMGIPNFEAAMHSCVEALRIDGTFIFSISHPCFEERGRGFAKKGYIQVSDYFAESIIEQQIAPDFHRTLSTYLNHLVDLGCSIQRILEPQLQPSIAKVHPEYRRDLHVPSYLIVSARKTGLASPMP